MGEKLIVKLEAEIRLFAVEMEDFVVTMTFQVTTFVDGTRAGSSFMDYDLEFDDLNEYDKLIATYDLLTAQLGKTLSEFTLE